MSIELDFDTIRTRTSAALRYNVGLWRATSPDSRQLAEKVGELMTHVMFIVAATTKTKGPERGIEMGLKMVQSWKD